MTPAEKESYEVGYLVGCGEVSILDRKYETLSERRAFSKGYQAGYGKKRRINKINNTKNNKKVDL